MNAPSNEQLSFLPDDYVAARQRARATRLCGTLLGIVVVGVACAFWSAERSLVALRAEHADVSSRFQLEADRLRQLDTLKRQQESAARRAGLAEAIVEKVPRTQLLGELRDLLPENTALTEVMMHSRVKEFAKTPEQLLAERQAARGGQTAPPEPQPKVYQVSLRVGGMAYTDVQVAQFISRLGRSRLFEDVNLLVSRESTHDGQIVRRFEVEMVVRDRPTAAPEAAAKAAATPAVVSLEASR